MSLESKLRPQKHERGADHQKSDNFGRISVDFWSILGAKISQKSVQKSSRKSIAKKSEKKRGQEGHSRFWQSHLRAPGPLGRGGGCKHPIDKKTTTRGADYLTRPRAGGSANYNYYC